MAWAAALGGAVGGGVSGGMGILSGYLGKEWGASASSKSWHRQLYLANTQYQRAVADLKAAGLNPMLAYQQGGNAAGSAPVARTDAPDLDVMPGVQSGISAAKQVMQRNKEMDILESQRKSANSASVSASAQAEADAKFAVQASQFDVDSKYQNYRNLVKQEDLLEAQRENWAAQTYRTGIEARRAELGNKLLEFTLPSAKAEGEFDATPEGQRWRRMKRRLEVMNPAVSTTAQTLGTLLR